MFFFLLVSTFSHLKCLHDEFQSNVPDPYKDFKLRSPILLDNNSNIRNPIRIFFDTTGIVLRSDASMCTNVNQTVSWSQGRFRCRSADIMDENKTAILLQTLENLRQYMTNLFNVTNEVNPICVQRVSDIIANNTEKNVDLYIAVAARPFTPSQQILGSAFSARVSDIDGRPIIGGMYLNPEYIPSEAQSEKTLGRTFYNTIFHELCHVLGISSSSFGHWIDRSTGKPYSNGTTVSYYSEAYKKRFRLIVTPYSQKFARERYNMTEFAPGVPPGIEIEDGGGLGTAGSHPESRVYLSEVMCGIFVGYTYISSLVLSLLQDSGWYDVNFALAEPYPWGDGKSLLSQPLKTFLNGPPQLSFPEHYLCQPTASIDGNGKSEIKNNYMCHYDYRSKAKCSPFAKFDCSSAAMKMNTKDQKACEMRSFVNPKKLEYRGDRSEFDYLLFKVPDESLRCNDVTLNDEIYSEDGLTAIGEEFGEDSMCAMSTLVPAGITAKSKRTAGDDSLFPRCYRMYCNAQQKLFIIVNNETAECDEEGQRVSFHGFDGEVVCPNPQHLCGMKQYLKLPSFEAINGQSHDFTYTLLPYTNEPQPTMTMMPQPTSTPNAMVKKIKLIVIGVILFGIIVVILIYFFFCKNRVKKENQTIPVVHDADSSDSDLKVNLVENNIPEL